MASKAPNLLGPSSVAVNAGAGPHFDVFEVGHPDYVALINADTAFWVLSPREEALAYLLGGELPQTFQAKEAKLAADLNNVRFGLLPSAVYFNPTERCNLDCGYCYLPREARKGGRHGAGQGARGALPSEGIFCQHPAGRRQTADRLPRRRAAAASDAVFPGIEQYGDDFRFGVQTNATLLDQNAMDFLTKHDVRHRHLAGRPHRRDRRPHPAHLGRQRRLRPDRQGPGGAARLPRAERHLHGHQRERPPPAGAGGLFPRTGGAQRPDEPGALHPARRPQPEGGPGGTGPLFLRGPGPHLRTVSRRPGASWSWATSPTSCWRSWPRRPGG